MKLPFFTLRRFTGFVAVAALAITVNSCKKEKPSGENQPQQIIDNGGLAYNENTLTQVLHVAHVRTLPNGTTDVAFVENAQLFAVLDPAITATLTAFKNAGKPVKVTFDPWQALVTNAEAPAMNAITIPSLVKGVGKPMQIDLSNMDIEALDNSNRLGVMNPTGALVNVVPDMATAQLMFNYITQQCCATPSPYEIDYCIPFQYAYDGCYARAHKMCWILNKKYGYDTHKIFSFANMGSDGLCVQAQKWGGCCVNWWYHVAPLVNIRTSSGVKAYVFDPAMFDQPVLLSVWLHAQENPACPWGTPNVSMINVQPTAMYAPADYSGYAFVTDDDFSSTNYTLVNYGPLTTCP